jgi:hypothetical protein
MATMSHPWRKAQGRMARLLKSKAPIRAAGAYEEGGPARDGAPGRTDGRRGAS